VSEYDPINTFNIVMEINQERNRQVNVEEFTPEHDDSTNTDFELSRAAACYATVPWRRTENGSEVSIGWPWAEVWFKPGSNRQALVKAAALIVAEIERLDRLEAKP
jgi:hypothetical protein